MPKRVRTDSGDDDQEYHKTQLIPETKFNKPQDAISFLTSQMLDASERSFHKVPFDMDTLPRACFLNQLNVLTNNATELNRGLEKLIQEGQIKWFDVPPFAATYSGSKILMSCDEWEKWIKYAKKVELQQRNTIEFVDLFLATCKGGKTVLSKEDFSEESLNWLVSIGLLLIKDERSFLTSCPHMGRFLNEFSKGQKEILNIIKKAKHKEVAANSLLQKVCRTSVFTSRFILWGLLGSGTLKYSKVGTDYILRLS
jgi:hypothetical protein